MMGIRIPVPTEFHEGLAGCTQNELLELRNDIVGMFMKGATVDQAVASAVAADWPPDFCQWFCVALSKNFSLEPFLPVNLVSRSDAEKVINRFKESSLFPATVICGLSLVDVALRQPLTSWESLLEAAGYGLWLLVISSIVTLLLHGVLPMWPFTRLLGWAAFILGIALISSALFAKGPRSVEGGRVSVVTDTNDNI